ncbi:MAG: alpha/beta hydrolase [Neptuniibacter sp.]
MALFDRSLLIKSLDTFSKTKKGIPNAEVESYLRHYQLHALAKASDYRIGRLKLDEILVSVQFFQQQKPFIAKGIVIITHGYMDHVGLYGHLIQVAFECGFDVVAYDMSGHGLSEGNPLDVDDFEHYALQLDELIKYIRRNEEIDLPIHLIGQSTGGAVICAQHLLLDEPQSLLGGKRILLAPLIRPAMWKSIQRRFRWLKYVISKVPRRYSRSSHDEAFVNFISDNDPLQHDEIPVGWIGAMLAWGEWVEHQQPSQEPLYIIQGNADKTVAWEHNMAVFKRIYPKVDISIVPEARHHLVNESDEFRTQVFERIRNIIGN